MLPLKRLDQERGSFAVVGIDLTAKASKPSPLCIFLSSHFSFNFLEIFEDEEIYNYLNYLSSHFSRVLLVMDSPIFWDGSSFRAPDYLLLRLGGRPLPMAFKSMQALYRRGKSIAETVSAISNVEVYETHPTSIAKINGFINTTDLFKSLFGYRATKGIADAALCCLAGLSIIFGNSIVIEESSFPLIIPLLPEA